MSFDRVRWIELPKVADKRGNLSFIEVHSVRGSAYSVRVTIAALSKNREEFIVAVRWRWYCRRLCTMPAII